MTAFHKQVNDVSEYNDKLERYLTDVFLMFQLKELCMKNDN